MFIELVIVCAVVYLIVASFSFVKLGKFMQHAKGNPTNFDRFVVSIFWPISVLIALVVVLIAWWTSHTIERSK